MEADDIERRLDVLLLVVVVDVVLNEQVELDLARARSSLTLQWLGLLLLFFSSNLRSPVEEPVEGVLEVEVAMVII